MTIDFGERVKNLRKGMNLTQDQLAKRVGVTKSVISAYETSMRRPSYEVLIKLAFVFKVTTDYLLGIDKRNIAQPNGMTEQQKRAIESVIEAFKE